MWSELNVLWVVIIGVVPTFLFAFLGVGFAPFSAAICALLAHRRGLGAGRYALAGGIYSAVLFLPSVYLMARLAGRTPPALLVILVYLGLLALWLAGSVVTPALYLRLELEVLSIPYSPRWFGIGIATSLTIVVNVTAMGAWCWWFFYRRPDPTLSPLPHAGYLVPFVLAPVGFLLFNYLGYVGDWIEALMEALSWGVQ